MDSYQIYPPGQATELAFVRPRGICLSLIRIKIKRKKIDGPKSPIHGNVVCSKREISQYKNNYIPRLIVNPKMNWKGFGMTTVVDPKLTRYTMSIGSEAMVGRSSLWRHLRLRTSSANPRKIIQHIDNNAAIHCTNYKICI